VAASSSDEARGLTHAAKFKLLRKLGANEGSVWAALEFLPNGRSKLVVAERVSRKGSDSEADVEALIRDTRRLVTLDHTNVARVRNVVVREQDVLVISDFVDGVRWSELTKPEHPSLEVSLRVLTDVLSGLSAIHNLRDEKRQPLGLVHGGLAPEFIIVGLDGVARVVGAHSIHAAGAARDGAASPYLAPEVLLGDDSADPRADIYGVGVMLWEALSRRALFPNTAASAIVSQVLGGKVPRAGMPSDAPWAAAIVDLVARALNGEAAKRLGSAAAFAAELRRITGPKLASTIRIAALVRTAHADQISARRLSLERLEGILEPQEQISDVADRRDRDSIDVNVDLEEDASPTPRPVAPEAVARRPEPPLPPPAPLPPPRAPATTIRGVNPPPVPRVPPAATARGPVPAIALPLPAPTPPPALAPALATATATALAPAPAPALAPAPAPAPALALAPAPQTADRGPLVETPAATPLPMLQEDPTIAPSVSSPPPAPQKPHAMRKALAAMALVVAAVGGTALLWNRGSEPPQRSGVRTLPVASSRATAESPPAPATTAAPDEPTSPTSIAAIESPPAAASVEERPPVAPAEARPAAAPVDGLRAVAPAEERPATAATASSARSTDGYSTAGPALQPAARPAAKRKYDPQGI
jgi:hypothetical protein